MHAGPDRIAQTVEKPAILDLDPHDPMPPCRGLDLIYRAPLAKTKNYANRLSFFLPARGRMAIVPPWNP
jgi:hypothetical protein